MKAKCSGWTKYFSGEITRVNSDGSYDIKFDDGERKKGVTESQIEGGGSSGGDHDRDRDRDRDSGSVKRREGDRVKAKCSGWTKYFSGEITRVNSDGSYDIKFDDGERKKGVTESQIEGGGSSGGDHDRDRDRDRDSGSVKRREGDRVKAKCSGWTKYFSGEITRVNSDGSYDIKFDDGERKKGVTESQIEGGGSSGGDHDRDRDRDRDSGSVKRREGDRVKAKCSGWTKYFSGEITRVNSDGSYDIKFDDGERKKGVTESQIEGGGSSGGDHDRDRDRDRDSGSVKRREGDRVKAKCTGWTKFYKGEITRVNSDGHVRHQV